MSFQEKKFNIQKLKGISEKNIEEHLKLYSGYVKNANSILAEIEKALKESAPISYATAELQRRFPFEYNGIRNHEIYFHQFENGPTLVGDVFKKEIEKNFGPFENWLNYFKNLSLTRGIGWAMLCQDYREKRLFNIWVDEQHLGQLNENRTILALDMWEHSYVADYQPSGKKQYIEDFFENINWKEIEKRLM